MLTLKLLKMYIIEVHVFLLLEDLNGTLIIISKVMILTFSNIFIIYILGWGDEVSGTTRP